MKNNGFTIQQIKKEQSRDLGNELIITNYQVKPH